MVNVSFMELHQAATSHTLATGHTISLVKRFTPSKEFFGIKCKNCNLEKLRETSRMESLLERQPLLRAEGPQADPDVQQYYL